MAYVVSPVSGIDLNDTLTVAEITAGQLPQGPLGMQVFGSDGKRYVYAKANATITASTTVCTINASTFLATATGGSYTSPATAMASGDYGWFAAASV
jgi:hypothetical protein